MAKTYLFWDPLEDNVVRETDEAGVVTAEYTTEPELYGNVISQRRQGEYREFHYDAQGSTLAATDENQNVTDTFAYTAFGEVTERTGTTEVPFQYVGRQGYYRDSLTGEYVARRRQYFSTSARWLAVDPLRSLLSFLVQSYVYVNNRPTSYVDPSGLKETSFKDPHTGKMIKFGPDICQTKEEIEKETKELEYDPCTFEAICKDAAKTAWESERVRACRRALEPYRDNSARLPGGAFRCGDLITRLPRCDLECGHKGLYLNEAHEIIICARRYASKETFDLEETLCHELIHAIQGPVCQPTNNPFVLRDSCTVSLRKEFQAYYCTSQCKYFEECLRATLRSSCGLSCNPLGDSLRGTEGRPSQKDIDDLYAWADALIKEGKMCPPPIERELRR